MFQRALFGSLTLIFLTAVAVYWFLIRARPGDDLAYHHLIHENTELRTRHALQDQPAHQTRQGVQKDIWSQNGSRHFQIKSDISNLTIWENKEKLEAVEELQKVKGTIQDGDNPKYDLRADEGVYTYPSHQFIGKKNCSIIQDQNRIDGTQIDFDLEKEIVTYLDPKGHLNGLDFTAHTLIWHKREGKLYLQKDVKVEKPNQFSIEGDVGFLSLVEFEPQLFVLEGNVRLISAKIQDQESFAAADVLTYNPLEKTMLLSSEKRVLFWQAGLHLSAPEVLIRQDPISKTEMVKGLGDVHFSFDLEEKNYIEELFKQFL